MRDFHVFRNSLLMGPSSKMGGSHISDIVSEDSATLTVSAAGEMLWTPAEITTAIWLDAADPDTITIASGKISQWADKSGNARHISQSSDAARPVITAAVQNGMDVVTFDGNDVLATAASFPETGNAEFSMFWVHKKTAAGGSVFGWGNSTNALQTVGFYDDGTGAGIAYSGGHAYFCAPATINTTNVWSYTKTAGAINVTSTLTKDGANAGTSGHSASTPNIVAGPLVVGQWANYTAGARLTGHVAELIICPAALDATGRQRVEGYLAHKWDLAASLPADHPYKSAAPTA